MVKGNRMMAGFMEGLSGIGTEGVVLITLFLVIKELVIPMWRKASGKPVHKYNPHLPGTAPECIKHVEELAGIKVELENIKEDIRDIKDKLD